jgi:hypothetical protein
MRRTPPSFAHNLGGVVAALVAVTLALAPCTTIGQGRTEQPMSGADGTRAPEQAAPAAGQVERNEPQPGSRAVEGQGPGASPSAGHTRAAEPAASKLVEELREDVENAVTLVLENKREIDELRRTTALEISELSRRLTELEQRINEVAQSALGKIDGAPKELLGKLSKLEEKLNTLERLSARIDRLEALDRVGATEPPSPLVPVPPSLSDQPWQVGADATGRLRLVAKSEAEERRERIPSGEECASVGKWIDERGTKLTKEGFFVRDGSVIAVCRRNQQGDWRVYMDSARTDRFHMVTRTRS